jgi:pilus assembly protein CpaF
MVAMAGYDIPMRALRQQVASAIQVVVQVQRLTGGKRRVTRVSEISGMEGDQIQMHDIFAFEQTGVDNDGHAIGHFACSGIRPRVLERIEHRGIRLPGELFMRRVITTNV